MAGLEVQDRPRILAALLLSMGLAAIDTTIVATAVPSIVRDLGGFGSFPWLFSAYLLTQAITIPLYGRLADLFGRKPVLLFGIGMFVLGSLLCGIAWSMPALIAFRGIQGLGAGAVQPVTTTIVADLYSLQERGKVQGYLSSVWGVTAVAGPVLGGALAEYGTWRWIFFINLPIGAVAAWLLNRHLHESVVRRDHRIDYAGAATLAGGLGLVIFGLLRGGVGWAWGSTPELITLACGVALLVWFARIERRSPEPMVPAWIFARRVLAAGNVSAFCVGALLFGLTSYLPPFAQGVLGSSPLVAGLTVAAVSISWSFSATGSSAVYLRVGFRNAALLGGLICCVGTLLLSQLSADSSISAAAGCCLVIGLGLGFAFTTVVVAVQSTAAWEQRGVVTGANMFTRSIGSAIGVAAFGGIANSTIAHALQHAPAAIAPGVPRHLNGVAAALAPGADGHGDPAAVRYLRQALFLAAHRVFLAFVAIAVLMVIAQVALPRRIDAATDAATDAGPVAGVAASPQDQLDRR